MVSGVKAANEEQGGLGEMTAGPVKELLIVCEAQNVLAGRIAVAETTVHGTFGQTP